MRRGKESSVGRYRKGGGKIIRRIEKKGKERNADRRKEEREIKNKMEERKSGEG